MERLGDVALILSVLDLNDIETVVWEPYHRDGAGRPPRNPIGIFKALVVKRLRQIPSDRELYLRLWNDPGLRKSAISRTVRGPTTHPSSPGSEGESGPRGSKGS